MNQQPSYSTGGALPPLSSLISGFDARETSEASSAESLLLDAAQTLVDVQPTSDHSLGSSPKGKGHQKYHQSPQQQQQQQQEPEEDLVHLNNININDLFRDEAGLISLITRTPTKSWPDLPPPLIPSTSSSGTLQLMGPPPPPPPLPSVGNNVTSRYVIVQTTSPNSSHASLSNDVLQPTILQAHSDEGIMQPPSQPPPSRRGRGSRRGGAMSSPVSPIFGSPTPLSPSGRGRGSWRGGAMASPVSPLIGPPSPSSPSGRGRGSRRGGAMASPVSPLIGSPSPSSPSGRGRGRGRGRGSKATAQNGAGVQNLTNLFDSDETDEDLSDGAEGFISQAEAEEKRRAMNETTFEVGSIAVRNGIFDELLNDRILELMADPEIQAVLEDQRLKTIADRYRPLPNSSSYTG